MRVLVLQDDARALANTMDELAPLEGDVIGVTVAAEAVRRLEEGIDGVIIALDDLTVALRFTEYMHQRTRGLPTILVTSHLHAGARAECERRGVLYVLQPAPHMMGLVEHLRRQQGLPPARHQSGVRSRVVATDAIDATVSFSSDDDKSASARRSQRFARYDDALARHDGNRTTAARELGITRQALQNFLRRTGRTA